MRIRSAWCAWSKVSSLMKSKIATISLKAKTFESCITSSVLYGCECWNMRASDLERLSTTQRKMERRMLSITLSDRWSNDRIRAVTRLRDWAEEAERRKLAWARKVHDMSPDRWAHTLTYWTPYNYSNARPQGRPKSRWRDHIVRVLSLCLMTAFL